MHTNQRLFVEELIRRGAKVAAVDESIELLEVEFQGRRSYLMDRAGPSVSYLSSALASDKHLTKHVLRGRGLAVPEGALFARGQLGEALDYGQGLGFPLAAKPNVGSHGEGVRSGLSSVDELREAILALPSQGAGGSHFVVERHVEGSEHRVFITAKGAFAALLREPASVLGDGSSSIEELAVAESDRRMARKAQVGGALCPIALDAVALEHLARRGLDFQSVPAAGEKVALRLSSNLAQGGLSTDVTELIHPSAVEAAKAALAAFEGLPCLGIDLICPDIARPLGGSNPYAIIEVNANPGLAMHHMPAIGQPRDVASYLADAMFPGS